MPHPDPSDPPPHPHGTLHLVSPGYVPLIVTPLQTVFQDPIEDDGVILVLWLVVLLIVLGALLITVLCTDKRIKK